MVGGLRVIVLSFKFHQNWLSSYRDVRGKNLADCITLAIGVMLQIDRQMEKHHACKINMNFVLKHYYSQLS